MNKKGIALSVRMLVVIILAVVIFSFGVAFLYNIMGKAFQLKGMVDEDLDRQVETILCDQPVCFASNYKKIYRGEFEVFGLRVYNNLPDEADFTIIADFNKAFRGDEEIEDAEDYIYWLPKERTIEKLGSHRERGIGIGIEVAKNAPSGIYVFNINVRADGSDYPYPQQIRVEVP